MRPMLQDRPQINRADNPCAATSGSRTHMLEFFWGGAGNPFFAKKGFPAAFHK